MTSHQIKDPVIIIGCPRSGTTLLFTILSESKELYSLYRESWNVIYKAYQTGKISPRANSDVLTEEDLPDDVKEILLAEFHKYTVNSKVLSLFINNHIKLTPKFPPPNPFVGLFKNINGLIKDMYLDNYRIVEKTPRNSLRIPFMNKLFPDAKYIFITRDGRSNISSLIEGWKRENSFVKYTRYPSVDLPLQIKGYDGDTWKYILPPGWEEYIDKPLEEVCAFQWNQTNRIILNDLAKLPRERVYKVKYEDLIDNTETTIKDVCNFINISYEDKVKQYADKPPVVSTPSHDKPRKDKWKKNEALIKNTYKMIAPMMEELGYSLDAEKDLANSPS